MKLLLHEDIPRLGYFGDVVEVNDGYARNYLLPQGLAVAPTQANIKAIEDERSRKAEQRRIERDRLVKTAEKIDGAEVTIKALANDMGHLFGSVHEENIAEALREAGFEVQTKHVRLGEHIRMLGSRDIKLRFAEDVNASITVHIVRPEDQAGESQSEQSEADQPGKPDAAVETESAAESE